MTFQLLCTLVAVYFSAAVFETPRRFTKYIAVIGCLGWAMYLGLIDQLGYAIATYCSSLLVAFLSHFSARYFKAPVTVFFIPAFFPLVPGAGMYRTAYAFMSGDAIKGQQFLGITLMTAGMIALAIFTVDSLFRIQFLIKQRRNKQTFH